MALYEMDQSVGEFIKAAEISGLSEGSLNKVIVNGTGLLLARVHGQVYATDLHCPHMGADLSQGTLHGTILTCPLHNSQFDIRDGHVVRWTDLKGIILTYATNARPPHPLSCYPVRIEGEAVLVGLPLKQ